MVLFIFFFEKHTEHQAIISKTKVNNLKKTFLTRKCVPNGNRFLRTSKEKFFSNLAVFIFVLVTSKLDLTFALGGGKATGVS